MENAGFKAKNRLKIPRGNIHFGKIFLTFMLMFAMVISNFNIAEANATKSMTITIGEGGLDQNKLSKVVNIPNLRSIVKVTSDTGTVTHTISGNNVTLNTSGGTPTRAVNNPKKKSRDVTDFKTSSTNNFTDKIEYARDSEGYSGELTKYGSVSSGDGWRYRSSIRHTKRIKIIRTLHYGSEGESKALSDAKYWIWSNENNDEYKIYETNEIPEYGKVSGDSRGSSPLEMQLLSMQASTLESTNTRKDEIYEGVVNGVYEGSGYVYQTMYTQPYRGTVYKAGTDNYYKYTVTIEYIDNSDPTLTVSLPTENSYFL